MSPIAAVVVLSVEAAFVVRPPRRTWVSVVHLALRAAACAFALVSSEREIAALALVGVGVHGARVAQRISERLFPDEPARVDVV